MLLKRSSIAVLNTAVLHKKYYYLQKMSLAALTKSLATSRLGVTRDQKQKTHLISQTFPEKLMADWSKRSAMDTMKLSAKNTIAKVQQKSKTM